MPANLTWWEARDLARNGQRVRRAGWETEWIHAGLALWFRGEQDGPKRVLLASDLTAEDQLARDWTTEPYTEPNICDRPPPETVFNPPGLSLVSILGTDHDELEMRAVVGAGTFGAYRLYYFIEGTMVAVDKATEAGLVARTIAISPPSGALKTSVRIESVLPLPSWSYTVTVIVPVVFPTFAAGYTSSAGPGTATVAPALLTNEFGGTSTWEWVTTREIRALTWGITGDLTVVGGVVTFIQWSNATSWTEI